MKYKGNLCLWWCWRENTFRMKASHKRTRQKRKTSLNKTSAELPGAGGSYPVLAVPNVFGTRDWYSYENLMPA